VTDDATVRLVHVVGPLGEPVCPKCGSKDVEKRGSWDWGPFFWECQDCDEQWGHA
jgi:ribosomal protein L37AE/L43A